MNVTDSTDYHHRAMHPRHHGNPFYPVYGFQRKEENAGFYPVFWQISALSGVRYAGYLLSENVEFLQGNHGAPELLAILVTGALHVWKRQMLLSIAGGTIFYMLLMHFM